jgi:ABC-2 type transport system ATP-binding protein
VLGFLGPNGAGKSTTMRMITGFIPPTSGEIIVGSYDIAREPIAARRLIGYLPENAPSYSDMTVHGFLAFAAEMRGLAGGAKKKAVHRVVEMCFLEPVLHQSIDTLSKGYKHRICFAQSIIHDPEILILDEPTDGLDPNQKHEVRSLIKTMGKNKADHLFDPHPRGGRGRLLARDHHRPRPHRRQRHAHRTQDPISRIRRAHDPPRRKSRPRRR